MMNYTAISDCKCMWRTLLEKREMIRRNTIIVFTACMCLIEFKVLLNMELNNSPFPFVL